MKEEKLLDIIEGFETYLEVLCKAILLDKVTITDGKIKVQGWDN